MADLQEKVSASSSSSPSGSPSLPQTTEPIDAVVLMIAEERSEEILSAIQPIRISDRSRNEVIKYLETLVRDRLGIQAFIFGSVPLKTYLPDGDIDVTVLTSRDKEEDYAKALCSILETEVRRSDFPVTNVQYIQAHVKVIKCNIRNISVDISFNQMAGLCALCFLEQIDQIFGKNHLFKRSVLLIKAWCFYESRILGANTGLISTYALAVLVLYVLNISYTSVSGPLEVLFKFLEVYESFDWDNNCVTVNGPVPISSLTDFTGKSVEETETGQRGVTLNDKFFGQCMVSYSVANTAVGANGRCYFPRKHINILDPLKHSNNLGRSVTEGNVRRIKHALTRGIQKLRDVLTGPGETIGWKVERFFRNTLERNGKGQRLDVEEPVIAFGTGKAELSTLKGDFEKYFKILIYGKWFHGENQHSWIPRGLGSGSWDVVGWYVTGQNNVIYWRNANGTATSMQNIRRSRGTGTYIPEMSQQSYSERFSKKPSTVKSLPSASQTQELKKNP